MIKCKIEFDNKIASPLSPREFIRRYVFRDDVILHNSEENKDNSYDDIYKIYSKNVGDGIYEIMEIRMINIEQKVT